MAIVLDASVALAWALDESGADFALFDSCRDSLVVVPSPWPLEFAQGLRTAERRGRIDRLTGDTWLAVLAEWRIEVDVSTPSAAWEEILEVADEHGLSLYDASYLELALRRGLPLATLDARLRAAAVSAGAAVV